MGAYVLKQVKQVKKSEDSSTSNSSSNEITILDGNALYHTL